MTVRIKHPREHSLVALVVICLLGAIAIIGTLSTAILIHEAVVYVPPNGQTIDAAVVALISQQGAITLASIAGLTAMLSSTSPKPVPPPTVPATAGAPESTPVTIVGPEPLPTAPVQPADAVAADPIDPTSPADPADPMDPTADVEPGAGEPTDVGAVPDLSQPSTRRRR